VLMSISQRVAANGHWMPAGLILLQKTPRARCGES
jgi:hypothetical protein